MFRWLWLFVPVALAGPGCAKLNSDFAAGGEGGGDATTAGFESTASAVSASDTQASADSGRSATTDDRGTTFADSTAGDGDSTAAYDASTAGHDDEGSTTDPTIGVTVGTDGSTGDPFFCPVVNEPCDAFAEDSCGAAGECRPYGFDGEFAGVACVEQPPAAQPLALGDTCSHTCPDFWGEDACPPRSICDPFSDAPTCVPLCGGSFPDYDCDEGMACEVHNVPSDSFGICRPECNLLLQDCPKGQTCVPDPKSGAPTCYPAPVDGPQQGEPCEFINACAVGYVCVPPGVADCDTGIGCCTALCEVDEDECTDGLVCDPFAAGAGACQVPG